MSDASTTLEQAFEIKNTFHISLRLISETNDFQELIPEINGYKFLYNKKGDNITKNGTLKAKANVLVIDDCFVCSSIDDESAAKIINKLVPIINVLSLINVNDLTREIYITGSIENQQFGFSIGLDFINFLAEKKYIFSFAGITYL